MSCTNKFCLMMVTLWPWLATAYSAEVPGVRGVEVAASYFGDFFGVVSGGVKRGAYYNGLFDVALNVDLEQLAGWRGGRFHVHGYSPHGAEGSTEYVGDLGVLSNLDAEDGYRLFELWLDQSFFNERLSLRAGLLALDSDFALPGPNGALFIQSGFGTPNALSLNLPLPTYPYAAPGVRLQWRPTQAWTIQLAIFDGNPAPGYFPDPSVHAAFSNELNRYGTHFALRHDEGAVLIGEVAYADRWRVGALYHTDSFALLRDPTRDRQGNYAFYANADHELWREPGAPEEGLGVFGQVAWMPPDRNFIVFSGEAALVYHGLFQNHNRDALGVGIEYLRVSRDAAGRGDSEVTLECSYRYQVATWWLLQPHVQYVIQPGGTGESDPALVLGIRTTFVF